MLILGERLGPGRSWRWGHRSASPTRSTRGRGSTLGSRALYTAGGARRHGVGTRGKSKPRPGPQGPCCGAKGRAVAQKRGERLGAAQGLARVLPSLVCAVSPEGVPESEHQHFHRALTACVDATAGMLELGEFDFASTQFCFTATKPRQRTKERPRTACSAPRPASAPRDQSERPGPRRADACSGRKSSHWRCRCPRRRGAGAQTDDGPIVR